MFYCGGAVVLFSVNDVFKENAVYSPITIHKCAHERETNKSHHAIITLLCVSMGGVGLLFSARKTTYRCFTLLKTTLVSLGTTASGFVSYTTMYLKKNIVYFKNFLRGLMEEE